MADDLHKQDPEQDRKARAAVIRVLRVVMLLLMAAVALLTILQVGEDASGEDASRIVQNWEAVLILTLGLAAAVVAVDVFTPVKKISTIGGVFLGLLAGMLGAIAIGFVIELVVETYGLESDRIIGGAKVLIGIALVYLGITIVLQTQDDFRLIIPYVEFAKQIRGVRPLLLDTSTLIDGRIEEVASTGVLQAPIVIPRFVVAELQLLADSSDRLKRARGRRGLELVTELQRNPTLDVSVDESIPPGKSVDAMLVELAQQMNGTIATTDSGLARVAGIHSVGVLNINDLANALKPNVIPGETMEVELIKPGEQSGQAVGYLDDGTMVVAEDGAASMGQRVTLTVTSTLQTSAGRMIFGRVNAPSDSASEPAAAPAGASDPDGPGPRRRPDQRRATARNPRRG